ncbi:hypothetical protein SLS58_000106 [Diplodia intermedia]|uniref:BZIP domain-containing protein n=1 Tax=Diplodia intermedia TaxID=856260 RepID=A0ABR3U6F1_9PEZI
MADPQAKDNLARIRDNQRRSRARRKEYLQELESKYRSCEQMGVQASAEIQAAAKRVLDENRRLRALLRHMGVSDADIDGFNDPGLAAPSPSAADALDTVLRAPRPCQPGSARSSCESSRSPASQGPTTTPLSAASLEPPAPPPPPQIQPSPRSYSSATSISSTFSTPAAAESPMVPISSAQPFPINTLTDPPSAYDPSYNAYYGAPNLGNWTWPAGTDIPHDPTQHMPNSSSCLQAADIIRRMRSDIGPELEQDMGCTGQGQDCKIDNTVVFDLVDKYSMQGL